jgi:hypothetical protein
VQRDREIADLSGRLSRLAATVEAVRAEASVTKVSPPNPPTLKAVRIEALGAGVPAARPPPPKSADSSAAASRSPASTSTSPPAVPLPPPPAGFASLIVADFPGLFAEGEKRWFGPDTPPGLFAEFRRNRFTLLWRGSRDGFHPRVFHGRCDGHANTLTLILDTKWNIFGGFTPVKWDDGARSLKKADPSLKSFLFTLKNPHNFPPRKFALKAEKKNEAIGCYPSWGPDFNDIGVYGIYNSSHPDSYTCCFGTSYANDTGLDRETFFTGPGKFTVKEIEVFEITD